MNNEMTNNLVSNTIQVNGMLTVSIATAVALQALDKVLEVINQELTLVDTIISNGREICEQSKGIRSVRKFDKRNSIWKKKRALEDIYFKVAELRYNLRIEIKK